jgi:DNA-binding beta-propeller fold protein YncE
MFSLVLFFGFINYQSIYDDYNYVYAFKPSNAPADDKSKQQQQSSNDKDSLEIDKEKLSTEKNIIGYKFVNSWGSYGSGDGQFKFPANMAVDSSTGSVYVVDRYNDRIQKFDSNGNFITKWGSNGTGDGEFYYPAGISVDSSSDVYVSDHHRIQKFDSNGNFITKWGSNGTGAIALDSKGYIYVADTRNDRIQKFDSNGNFITKWGSEYELSVDYGSGSVGFQWPNGISVESSTGSVYVTDNFNNFIQKFDSNGNFITKWKDKSLSFSPYAISVDSNTDYIYVSDSRSDIIQKFDSNGNFITKWGRSGTGYGEFDSPEGIAVNSSTGYVYVADSMNRRIQVFAPAT